VRAAGDVDGVVLQELIVKVSHQGLMWEDYLGIRHRNVGDSKVVDG